MSSKLLGRTFIWSGLEAILGIGLGVLFLRFGEEFAFLAQVTFVLTGFLVIHRVLIAIDVSRFVESEAAQTRIKIAQLEAPVGKLSEAVDLSTSASIPTITQILYEYLKVREDKLHPERSRIVDLALNELKFLNVNMRTPTLEEPDFYQWLFREFELAQSGTKIEIVSMDEDVEWLETFQEEKFFKANVDAAKRGVQIERIFLFTEERKSQAASNKFIYAHRSGNIKNLSGRWVERNAFIRSAPTAISDAGQGFLLFNRHFAIVDVFSADGQARGYATFNPSETQRYFQTFERFRSVSAPLTFP